MIKKVYAKLPDGTRKQVHSIDFSNQYVEVVDYMAFDGISEWCLDDVEIDLFQQRLNEKQKEMLSEVINCYKETSPKTVLNALIHLSETAYLLDEIEDATETDCIAVALNFLQWAKKQEEEK